MPYEADPGIWLDYYYKLELFVRLFSGQPLYVHGRVVMPCEATESRRRPVYRMFMYNTPFSLFDATISFRFRLLFIQNRDTRKLRIDQVCLMPYSGGPPLYPDFSFSGQTATDRKASPKSA